MIRKFFKSETKVKEARELKTAKDGRESKVAEAPPPDGNLSLHHFILHDLLGEGAFGKVRIVEHIVTQQKFALKYMSKKELIKSKSVKNVFRERIILEQIEHPYIVGLKFAFQDDEYAFFVMDYVQGGDLKAVLKKLGTIPHHVCQYLVAQIGSALDHIHSKEIVHRDLKPANILCDCKGNFYITDFNCSISLKERVPNSKAGSLEYMAPEMFIRGEYKFSVDWWSLGVILFQCTFGCKPFQEKRSKDTITAIRTKDIRSFLHSNQMDVPKDQTSFLMGLLDRNIKTRFGASKHGHGFKSDIVSHPFLKNINWNLLDTKQYPTKFEPEFSASKVKESSADLKKGSVLSFESSKQYNMFTQSKASSTLSDINSLVNNSGSMPSIESREHIESNLLATCFHPYNSLVTNNSPVEMPSYFLRPKSVTPANRPSPSVPNIRHDNTGAA